MKRFKSMMHPKTSLNILSFLFLFGINIFSQESHRVTIHLMYTSNLNGALDDCRCGGNPVGGMTRVLTVFQNLRAQYPDALLVDGGDFLLSYTLPAANRLMLRLLEKSRYTALNLGDQEFVESQDFVFENHKNPDAELAFLSANLLSQEKKALVAPYKIIRNRGITIAIIGLVDRNAFEFITASNLQKNPLTATLTNLANEVTLSSELQILLFHGSWETAESLLENFPWMDVIILAHNQKKQFSLVNKTALAESGRVGEYVGFLRIRQNNNSWEFENEFIPVNDDVTLDPEAQQWVDEYFHGLE
jgi:sulfur-oxidizing protein SoxB